MGHLFRILQKRQAEIPMNTFSVKQYGVTLIELLMAMAIIAVISSIAIPMYSGYISTARETEAWYNISDIKMAEEEYFLENNSYFPAAGSTASTTDGSLDTYWIPESGTADFQFAYTVSTNASGTKFYVRAQGKGDKVPTSVSFFYNN